MGKRESRELRAEHEPRTKVTFTEEMALYFRDRIRSARSAANADAEAYMEAVHVIEDLGRILTPGTKPTGMAKYHSPIRDAFFEEGQAAADFDAVWSVVLPERNSAVHEGAAARHLTSNLIDLLVQIEDAMTTKALPEGDKRLLLHIMVRNPVCAEKWMTLAMVRKTMLTSSFSTIPVFRKDKWHLVTDEALARVADKKHLNATIDEAVGKLVITVVEARVAKPDITVGELLAENQKLPPFPTLVLRDGVHAKDGLLGILSAYDLL